MNRCLDISKAVFYRIFIVWQPETEIFEYICKDNNFANVLMIGVESEVEENSRIAP